MGYLHDPLAGASSGRPDRSRAGTEPRWHRASPEQNREDQAQELLGTKTSFIVCWIVVCLPRTRMTLKESRVPPTVVKSMEAADGGESQRGRRPLQP